MARPIIKLESGGIRMGKNGRLRRTTAAEVTARDTALLTRTERVDRKKMKTPQGWMRTEISRMVKRAKAQQQR